jgi:hypothetical protein
MTQGAVLKQPWVFVKPQPNIVAVLCNLDEAEMLLQVAKHFCPDAVPEIEKEIRLVQRVSG